MRNRRSFLVVAITTLCCLHQPASALDKSVIKMVEAEFGPDHRAVRASFLAYPNYTLMVDGRDHACDIPTAFRRLATQQKFRIRKVHAGRQALEVELESQTRRRVKIVAHDRGELSQSFLDAGLRRLLSDIFEFGEPPPPVTFVGHLESRLLHLDRCNHLPAPMLRKPFKDKQAALAAGFRACPICFGTVDVLPYEAYGSHRLAALQAARTFELVFPLSEDREAWDRLAELGAEVLDHWPLDLAGFDYEFRLVKALTPLAVAFPTGIVAVSDALLDAADADEEILFVLAHEIAHCELHLPPMVPFTTDPAEIPSLETIKARRAWAIGSQFAADVVAMNWFQGLPAGRRDAQRARGVLAKVQHLVGGADQLVAEAGSTRGLHERLWLFEPKRFVIGNPRRVFCGVDGDGNVRHELRFLGMFHDVINKKYIHHFLLTTTDYQDKPFAFTIRDLRGDMRDASGRFTRLVLEPFMNRPTCSIVVTAETEFADWSKKFRSGGLQEAKLWGLPGVKAWRVATGDDVR